MIEITKRFTFEAAHELPWHGGKCKNLHGHSYRLEVTLAANSLEKNGIVIDFDDLSEIVKKVASEKYDHKFLNNFFKNPTAEILAQQIFQDVEAAMRNSDVSRNVVVSMVRLWETEKCFVTVT